MNEKTTRRGQSEDQGKTSAAQKAAASTVLPVMEMDVVERWSWRNNHDSRNSAGGNAASFGDGVCLAQSNFELARIGISTRPKTNRKRVQAGLGLTLDQGLYAAALLLFAAFIALLFVMLTLAVEVDSLK